jgi:nucleoside-diphosphate-sugar epimerase
VAIGDLRDGHGLSAAARGADAIVHCASPRSLDAREVAAVEIDGMTRLLDTWQRGPFVTMSSQTVYGVPDRRLTEDAPLCPGSWYDHGKLACESLLAMEAGRGARGPGVVFRLPLLFGAGPRRRSRQFLPGLVDALRRRDRFVFADPESARRHGTVYIGDRDLGLAAIAALGMDRGGPYNLASGFVSWRVLLDTLGSALGITPRIAFRSDDGAREADEFRLPRSRTAYDCRRFRLHSGFAPSQDLATILQRFLDAEEAGVANAAFPLEREIRPPLR